LCLLLLPTQSTAQWSTKMDCVEYKYFCSEIICSPGWIYTQTGELWGTSIEKPRHKLFVLQAGFILRLENFGVQVLRSRVINYLLSGNMFPHIFFEARVWSTATTASNHLLNLLHVSRNVSMCKGCFKSSCTFEKWRVALWINEFSSQDVNFEIAKSLPSLQFLELQLLNSTILVTFLVF
jgi:hypothetical protein